MAGPDRPEDAQPRTGARDELPRIRASYDAYGRSRRKRRAWAASNRGNMAIRAELLSATWTVAEPQLTGSGPILDAGCGTGYWLRALAGGGVAPQRLHGVELLPERVAACSARLPPQVDVRRADVRRLPHPDGTFDVVLLFTVLSSLAGPTDVRLALHEAQRVTRPGGAVLVYEPRGRSANRRTVGVPLGLIRSALGSVDEIPITVWPPVARRLGPLTPLAYPRLATLRWATSHRLAVNRSRR